VTELVFSKVVDSGNRIRFGGFSLFVNFPGQSGSIQVNIFLPKIFSVLNGISGFFVVVRLFKL